MTSFSNTQESSVKEERPETEEHSKTLESTKCVFEMMLKKLILFVSFGPGVLGVLWLIGRILRR